MLGVLLASVIGSVFWYLHRATSHPNTSSRSGWRVFYASAVYSLFMLLAAWLQLSVPVTALILPLPAVLSWLAIRARVGIACSHGGTYQGNRFQLVTLPGSHYGEKVRWILDAIGAPYDECTVPGYLTVLFRGRSLPWIVDRKGCAEVGNSAEALMYLGAVHVPTIQADEQRSRAEQLMRRDQLTAQWETKLDVIGICLQGWGYGEALKHDPTGKVSQLLWGGYSQSISWIERQIILRCYPLLKATLSSNESLDPMNESLQQERKEAMLDVLDQADEQLSKHKFLTGDSVSYIDFAFCALTSPFIGFSVMYCCPSLWAAGRFPEFAKSTKVPGISMFPSSIEHEIKQRPCGQFVLRMYREHRTPEQLQASWPQ